jgi:hypothetical protein
LDCTIASYRIFNEEASSESSGRLPKSGSISKILEESVQKLWLYTESKVSETKTIVYVVSNEEKFPVTNKSYV